MRALIIGGNRFFGKRLVRRLLDANWDVTLLNRGSLDDGFGPRLTRIRCDRQNSERLAQVTKGLKWDVVFDQMCFDWNEAKFACEIFNGKTARYIFTSSESVYESGANLRETDFDPCNYRIDKLFSRTESYAEAKRQAEVAFAEHGKFSKLYVRFPFVVGADDYTGRFQWHVDQIKNEINFYLPDPGARLSFIDSQDAADGLFHLATSKLEGPVNVASEEPLQLKHLVSTIEEVTGKAAQLNSTRENPSPYGTEGDWYMNTEKLRKDGFQAKPIKGWLKPLIKHFATLAAFAVLSLPAQAAFETRLLAAIHEIEAPELNAFYTDQDLKALKKLPGFKIDVTYGLGSRIFLGLRVAQYRAQLFEDGVAPGPERDYSKLIFEYYSPILRLYLLNGDNFRFDIFGGAGGARAMAISKKDDLEQRQGIRDDDLRFMQFAGGAFSFGMDRIMLTIEGGYEWTRLTSLNYTANSSPQIPRIDLNGSYVAVGINSRFK